VASGTSREFCTYNSKIRTLQHCVGAAAMHAAGNYAGTVYGCHGSFRVSEYIPHVGRATAMATGSACDSVPSSLSHHFGLGPLVLFFGSTAS
jgi:ABC-type Co2+ transport system permease subunit